MLTTILYVLWWLCPISFFGFALWSKLEQMSHKGAKPAERVAPYLRQAVFLTAAAGISTIIDKYFLEELLTPILPDFFPFELAQIVLFPLVLWLLAMLVGGTKPVKIEKISHVSKRKRK